MKTLLNDIDKVSKDKQLIVFDLDGTLSESKAEIDNEMAGLLAEIMATKKIAIISGGKFDRFEKQVLSKLSVPDESMANLFLFPVTATKFYHYTGGKWTEVYSQSFSDAEKKEIMSALERTFREMDYKHPDELYGELIEDRGSQITFSVLGQEAPADIKEKWNKENPDVRAQMEKILQRYLPDIEVKVAGLTSIDITRRGIDKAYGIRQMEKYLNIPVGDMLFVGDNFSHEGNDEPVLETGVLCFGVKSTQDTKQLIAYLLSK